MEEDEKFIEIQCKGAEFYSKRDTVCSEYQEIQTPFNFYELEMIEAEDFEEIGKDTVCYLLYKNEKPVVEKIFNNQRNTVYRFTFEAANTSFIYKKFKEKKEKERELELVLYLNQLAVNRICIIESYIFEFNAAKYKIEEPVHGGGICSITESPALLFENMDGDLSELQCSLKNGSIFSIIDEIFRQVICLSNIGLLYLDIKLQNIFYKCVNENIFKILLGDLGSLDIKIEGGEDFFATHYPPSLKKGELLRSHATIVWGIGVVALQLSGREWKGAEKVDEVIAETFNLRQPPSALQKFIERLLDKNAENREELWKEMEFGQKYAEFKRTGESTGALNPQ